MSKPVYNQRYYKIKALLKNQAFQADVQWLRDQFTKYDVPVPKDGFESYKDYLAWNEKFWHVWGKQDHSPEVKELWTKYADPKDNKIYTAETLDEYEIEKAELVPPVYGSHLRDIATKYGFDGKDKDIHDFLTYYIFLGKDEITNQSVTVTHRRSEKTQDMEMYVRIFPWTTKQDIVNGWSFIKEEQAWYRAGMERNQEWKNFERDYRIYEIYNEAREQKATGDDRRLEEITYALYYAETNDDIDYDNIKRIVHETRKRLGLGDGLPSDNS